MATPRTLPFEQEAPQPSGQGFRAALVGMYTLWYRDLIRFFRDRTRIIGSFAQPLLFLVIFGSGLSPAIGQIGGPQSGVDYGEFIFPGIIAMAVLFTAVFSSVSIIWDREFGFLREVLVAPIPRWSLAIGKALGGSTTALIQGVLMLIFAPLVGVGLSVVGVLELLPLLLITAFSLSAFGLLIAARMRSMEGFQLIMNFLMMPMFFLPGAFFPLSNLPGWLTVLTRINPFTYSVDAIRKVVLGDAASEITTQYGLSLFGVTMTPLLDMLVVLAFGLVMIAFAVVAFNRQD